MTIPGASDARYETLERRVTEMDTGFKAHFHELRGVISALHTEVGGVTRRLDKVEQRLGRVEERLGNLERRVSSLETRMEVGFAAMNARFDRLEERLTAFIKAQELISRRLLPRPGTRRRRR